jgi:peptide deformylase
MVREVILQGNEILSKVCEPVDMKSDDIKALVADLKETVTANFESGLGFSAPQIGVLKRIFVMRTNLNSHVSEIKDKEFTAVINPEIKKVYPGTSTFREGCLSVPNKLAITSRDKSIKVKYYDENGVKQEMHLKDTEAVVFQHEYDHLNGILMTDPRRAMEVIDNPDKKEDKTATEEEPKETVATEE